MLLYQVGIQNKGISHDFSLCTNRLLALICPIFKNIFLPSIQFTVILLRMSVLVVWSKGLILTTVTLNKEHRKYCGVVAALAQVSQALPLLLFLRWHC